MKRILNFDLGQEYTTINISWIGDFENDPFDFDAQDESTLKNYHDFFKNRPYIKSRNNLQFQAKGIITLIMLENVNVKVKKDVKDNDGYRIFPKEI
jgi:hypothetical protein